MLLRRSRSRPKSAWVVSRITWPPQKQNRPKPSLSAEGAPAKIMCRCCGPPPAPGWPQIWRHRPYRERPEPLRAGRGRPGVSPFPRGCPAAEPAATARASGPAAPGAPGIVRRFGRRIQLLEIPPRHRPEKLLARRRHVFAPPHKNRFIVAGKYGFEKIAGPQPKIFGQFHLAHCSRRPEVRARVGI